MGPSDGARSVDRYAAEVKPTRYSKRTAGSLRPAGHRWQAVIGASTLNERASLVPWSGRLQTRSLARDRRWGDNVTSWAIFRQQTWLECTPLGARLATAVAVWAARGGDRPVWGSGQSKTSAGPGVRGFDHLHTVSHLVAHGV